MGSGKREAENRRNIVECHPEADSISLTHEGSSSIVDQSLVARLRLERNIKHE